MAKQLAPEQLTLSNGIPVVLQQYEGAVAATYWWVQTGSADERPPEAGFAHFLEHMHFKDTDAKSSGKASEGRMARLVESLGGDINAYTSFDQTVYHVTSAAQHWEKIVDGFGAMAKPQRFSKGDFDREREVILEELRKNEDTPGRQLFQKLFTAVFKKHPYGRPVIGYVKTLKAAKVGQLEAFYRRNYVPARMGIILVGPIEDGTGARRKRLLALLEKHYGGKVLKKRPAPTNPRPTEAAERAAPEFTVLPFAVKTPTVAYAFRVPDLDHEDVPALDLMSGILGMGELSRLYQSLFQKRSLVTEVSGGLYVPRDPGMLYFQAEMDSMEKIPEVSRLMFEEFNRLAEEGPTPEELARVLASAESERLYSTQTADGMAGRIGFLKYILGDLEFDRRYLDDLREVDAAKIREVARKYLDYARLGAVVMVPKEGPKFSFDECRASARRLLTRAAPAAEPARSKPAARTKPPVEIFRLPSGIQVVYADRPQSHVFSVHASSFGGLRLEGPEQGLSYMMALTWSKGTPTKDSQRIAQIVEGAAAGLDGFSGRNTVGLQMTGLGRDWKDLSSLFGETLWSPTFPEDEVGHSRRLAEDSVRSIEDHTSQLCSKLFLETLFEHHPYGRMTVGTLETLAKVDSAALRRRHAEWVRPAGLTLAVSGCVSRTQLDAWLRELESAATKLKAAAGAPARIEAEPALKAPRWVDRPMGREQAHILVGGRGTRVDAEDRHALRLMQNILGGQSGRLFIELREKKSLAYTVAPVSFEGLEPGYAGTYIACSPGKSQEAVAGIRTVLETLAQKGPTPAEMKRAHEYQLGRKAMDLQSDSAIASHYGLEALYGIAPETDDEMARRIRAISARDVQAVCRKYLVDPPMVTAVVG